MREKKKPMAAKRTVAKRATAKPAVRKGVARRAPAAKSRAAPRPKPSGRSPTRRAPRTGTPAPASVSPPPAEPPVVREGAAAGKRVEAVSVPAASAGRAPLFDAAGTHTGEYLLPEPLFASETSGGVVRQAVLASLANARQGNASTRNRSRVSGGGAKPWRQKGTGRARQGSIRAPHWRHGAVVFGPNGRVYDQRVPRKMRQLALAAALTASAREGRVIVIEDVRLDADDRPRTRDASALLARLGATRDSVLVTTSPEAPSLRAFANLPQVSLRTPRSLQLVDVLVADRLIFAKDALQTIAELRA